VPFPSTKVVPGDWSRHHAPVARGGMNATVTVGTKGPTSYDPDTDDTTATWSTDYNGPARIQTMMRAHDATGGDQPLVGRTYLVQLDFDRSASLSLRPGMRVRVVKAPNDALLAGQDLWVVDVQLGSERFTRDVVCSDNETDAPATS